MGTRCADHVTPLYPQKLALTSPTGGRSVGIVRSRTKATEFSLVLYCFSVMRFNGMKTNVYLNVCKNSVPPYTKHITKHVEIKCQLDTKEVFIAVLIACSTCFGHHHARHQELKSIIQWLLPVVFRAVVFKLLVWCGADT